MAEGTERKINQILDSMFERVRFASGDAQWPMSGVRLMPNRYMLPGKLALVKNCQIVWIGPVGAPIEDAEFDAIILHPDDVARLTAALSAAPPASGRR